MNVFTLFLSLDGDRKTAEADAAFTRVARNRKPEKTPQKGVDETNGELFCVTMTIRHLGTTHRLLNK